MRAAGVNFVDGLFVQGKYQIKPPLPFTPGGEVAGDVVAVGDGVDAVAVGDRVLAMPWLGRVRVPRRAGGRRRRPDPRRPDLRAGRRAGAELRHDALLASPGARSSQAGEWVLVLGAGGGIGLAAVDVARHLGARVIAAASSDGEARRRPRRGRRGHHRLRDRGPQGAGPGAVAAAASTWSSTRSATASPSRRCARCGWMGRYLVIGFAGGDIPRLPINQVLLNNRTLVGVDWGAWTMRDPDGNQALLARAHGAGRLGRPPPGRAARVPARRRRAAPSPTCRTARWPARSSSSPESAARRSPSRHHGAGARPRSTKANRSCS